MLVEDGQVIVLGGLIQDALTDGTDKVPLAGDVPVVGQLFRYDQRKRVKTQNRLPMSPPAFGLTYVLRPAAPLANH